MGLSYLWLVLGALVTGIIAYAGVAFLRRWAARGGMLDVPNARSSHTVPTPRGGGLAIATCTLTGLWLLLYLGKVEFSLLPVAAYTGGALVVTLISWYDDRRSVSNRVRFGLQAVAALLVILSVGGLDVVVLPVIGELPLGWSSFLITLLWIIGLTNAYNFMDGIDGLAGGQAVVAGISWFILGWWMNNSVIALLGLVIAASSSGFLFHNWPPARIFMGDVGSAFLGFTFAVCALIGSSTEPRLAFVGMVMLWPFIFDTTWTLLRRLRRGENIFQAHRSHLYQRLVIAGYSHRTVTIPYLVVALGSSIVAMLWLRYPLLGNWVILLWLLSSAAGLYLTVQRVEATFQRHAHRIAVASISSPDAS